MTDQERDKQILHRAHVAYRWKETLSGAISTGTYSHWSVMKILAKIHQADRIMNGSLNEFWKRNPILGLD